jgi:Flp pilus assembly protein TadD
VLEILGRDAEAENVYRKGIRVFFDYPDTWVALGIVLAKQGKVREAIDSFRDAKRGGPEGKLVRTPRR